jgi:hypothetical protein
MPAMPLLPAIGKNGRTAAAGIRTVLWSAVVLLVACSGSTNPPASRFFSCAAYFEGEALRLAQNRPELRKDVTRNGMHNALVMAAPDWKRELEPFVQCDIGKPSLASAYRADTLLQHDTLRYLYTATEASAPVRQVAVLSTAGRIVRIVIETGDTNALFSTRRHLDYRPEEGYDIEGMQVMKLGETTRYTVQARWK